MSVRSQYDDRVRSGEIIRDPAQAPIVERLDALARALEGYSPARKSAALGWLLGSRPAAAAPRGLYVWGGVGRGKSMLMDLFFEQAAVARKKRVHFHAFMAQVHADIFKYRQALKRGEVKGEDPIEPVATAIAAGASLLCFDEFTITDIADAMILGRLFKVLFARGTVVVATSNVEPSRLYEGGLNRQLFLPSIDLIAEHMEVACLDSSCDHRMAKLAGLPVCHVPADAAAKAALTATFAALTGRESGTPAAIRLLGRTVAVPQARGSVARFGFADLCEKPLGASDYLAVARNYRTVIVDDIPVLKAAQRNEAKRFIILVDSLYEARTKLFASAAAEPSVLFEGTEGREAFEFQRTVSRLNEMQSADYMALPAAHGVRPDMAAIVDT